MRPFSGGRLKTALTSVKPYRIVISGPLGFSLKGGNPLAAKA
ncbi:MAG: hypothetical protein N4A65_09010 [Cohaesibacter sp.]|jgi:hypothetical protein|nr:hypothetical protein [Cohaesibacter sp.]